MNISHRFTIKDCQEMAADCCRPHLPERIVIVASPSYWRAMATPTMPAEVVEECLNRRRFAVQVSEHGWDDESKVIHFRIADRDDNYIAILAVADDCHFCK